MSSWRFIIAKVYNIYYDAVILWAGESAKGYKMYKICLSTTQPLMHEYMTVNVSRAKIIELVRGLGLSKRIIMTMGREYQLAYDLDANDFKPVANMSQISILLEDWGDRNEYKRVLGYLRHELQRLSVNQKQ